MRIDNRVNPPMEEALTHYGVRGMKWGVRKSRSHQTFVKAKTAANNRMIQKRKRYSNSVLGRIPGYKKMQAQEIKKLQDSNRRLKNGKGKVRDYLDVYSKTRLSDLVVANAQIRTSGK